MKKWIICLILLSSCMSIIITPVCALDMPVDPPFYTRNIEEYYQYVENTEFDYDFVLYDKFSYLGNFKSYKEPDPDSEKRRDTYEIEFFDSYTAYILVDYDTEMPAYDSFTTLESMPSDLRYQQATSKYMHNENIMYTYDQIDIPNKANPYPDWRRLGYLHLKVDDKIFHIGFTFEFVEMPSEDQPIYKFLNKETVDEAYAEFVYHITGELPSTGDEPNNTTPTTPNDSNNVVNNNTTDNTTTDNTTAATDTEQSLIEKLKSFDFGCQSVISGSAVTLLLSTAAAVSFIPKKKKRE